MTHTTTASFDALPDSAYIREAQLVRSSKRPHAPALLPFSGQTLWRQVRAGLFPAPRKLSPNVTAWLVRDVRQWLKQQEQVEEAAEPKTGSALARDGGDAGIGANCEPAPAPTTLTRA